MPKMLIVETTVVNYGDDRGGVVETDGTQVSVPKDVGADLARAGRAVYLIKADDPTKEGRYTIDARMLAAFERERKAKAPAGDGGSDQ